MASTRRLAAILAADVAGYSRLMGQDEEGTHARLQAHLRELVDPKIAEHRGRIVKNTGDGLLAEFPSVVDAVRYAVEVQRGMMDREPEVPDERRIRFRIGVNLGDVIAEEHDIFGDGVNVAARLEALAEPGGICISRMVRDQIRDKLAYPFEDLGEQQVKNIARPVRVYGINSAAMATLPPVVVPQPLMTLTKASSLPEKFAYPIAGTKRIKAYTADARLIEKGVPNTKTVSHGFGSKQTTTSFTTFSYIFELDNKNHYPIDLINFSLPFAIGVRVTFLLFEYDKKKEILFSVYNHSDPRWIELPPSNDKEIYLFSKKEMKIFLPVLAFFFVAFLTITQVSQNKILNSVLEAVMFTSAIVVWMLNWLRKVRLRSSMRRLQRRVELR